MVGAYTEVLPYSKDQPNDKDFTPTKGAVRSISTSLRKYE